MKTSKQIVLRLSLAGLLLGSMSAPAAVIHRYSFNEASGTVVSDSVGAANGVLTGTGGTFDGAGQLVLPGGGVSTDPAGTIAGYVDLPNHLINGLTNVTFEAWVTVASDNTWQRIMDFGVPADGIEGSSTGNGSYFFICSPTGNPPTTRSAVRDTALGELTILNDTTTLPVGAEACVTVTYDTVANVARMYVNGIMVSTDDAPTKLSAINDINNWLGRSQWPDSMFAGSYNEFRIHNGALDPVSVAASFVSGPNSPSTNVTVLGAIQNVTLNVPITVLTVQDTQPTTSTAEFANFVGSISLTGVSGVTFQSSNVGVATVDTNGLITATGAGQASITVNYLGKSSSVAVTVNPRLAGVVVAGALEVDLRATDLATSVATWTNRALANSTFTAEGTPVYNANVAKGLAGVTFNGTTDDYVGPLASANIAGNSDFSIEAWAFLPSLKAEETLVAWGYRGTPGADVALGAGNNATFGAASFWGGGYDLGWSGVAPVAGAWHYYVLTYNGARLAKVYADGKLRTQLTVPANLVSQPDANPIRIAAQNAADLASADFGQALVGSIAMARVHTGILSDNDVANNFLYGVELTAPGALQSITVTLTATNLPSPNATAQAAVTANYANRSYLSVNGFSTFSSSDTSVATVDVNGAIKGLKVGSAQIIASYGGLKGTNTITVLAPPATQLLHRYSFSETSGTTVADSVGTAHGTLAGGLAGNAATLSGGQVSMPGGTGSAAGVDAISGYVDLPNHIIDPLINVSFEVWTTWQGPADSVWQRVFDLGRSAAGEDVSDGNGDYLMLNTRPYRFVLRDPITANEPVILNANPNSSNTMPTGVEFYIAVTYNFSENVSRLYTNGVLAATGTAPRELSVLNDVNNWLGRSQWGDPMYNGSINEFRIYEGALTPDYVASANTAGPNALPALTKPSLSVVRGSGTVTISWATNGSAGYVLQSSGAVGASAGGWSNVTGTPTVSGANYQMTVPTSGTQQFYKLTK